MSHCNPVLYIPFLFADDSNLFVEAPSIYDLFIKANEACSQINTWFTCNLLTVNLTKSLYILFFPSKSDDNFIADNNVTVTINNTCLNRVKSIKFLGIVLDELLSFKEHIAFVARGINRVNGMLYKRRDLLPENCRRQLYFALVHSRINYGIEVYGSAKWSALKCVYVACNRLLRTLQNRDRY